MNRQQHWGRAAPARYQTLGECDANGESTTVTWSQGGVDTEILAILERQRRGDAMKVDGDEVEEADATITVRYADLPAVPTQHATVTAPRYPASEQTESWVVGEIVEEHGNGDVTFALWRGEGRRYRESEAWRD